MWLACNSFDLCFEFLQKLILNLKCELTEESWFLHETLTQHENKTSLEFEVSCFVKSMWYKPKLLSELSNKALLLSVNSHVGFSHWFYTIYSGITVCFVCSLFSVIVVQSSSLWRFTSTLYSQITLLTVPRRKKKCIRYLQRGRCASPHSSDGSAIDSPPSPVNHPPNPASPTSSPLPQSTKRSAHPPRLSLDFSRIKTESHNNPDWRLDRRGDRSHVLQVLFSFLSLKKQTSSHGASSHLLGSHGIRFLCGWISWRIPSFIHFNDS